MEALWAIFVVVIGATAWSLKWRTTIGQFELGFNSIAQVESGREIGINP